VGKTVGASMFALRLAASINLRMHLQLKNFKREKGGERKGGGKWQRKMQPALLPVVAICLSICVFSCRPNAWGLALWRGCQRAAMASAIADLPPTSQRLPTIHHPLGHPSCRAELSFRPVCGRRFLATFSACAGRAVFELPPAVD